MFEIRSWGHVETVKQHQKGDEHKQGIPISKLFVSLEVRGSR